MSSISAQERSVTWAVQPFRNSMRAVTSPLPLQMRKQGTGSGAWVNQTASFTPLLASANTKAATLSHLLLQQQRTRPLNTDLQMSPQSTAMSELLIVCTLSAVRLCKAVLSLNQHIGAEIIYYLNWWWTDIMKDYIFNKNDVSRPLKLYCNHCVIIT